MEIPVYATNSAFLATPRGGLYYSRMFKGIICLILMASGLLLMCMGTLILRAQSPAPCPPFLASLMPKGAVNVTGQYMAAGMVGIGAAAADLPFVHPCANQTTKYPGHIGVDVQHYKGDGVKLFKMQVDSVEKQTLQSERAEMERRLSDIRKTSTLGKISDVKTETVPGGTLLYYDYYMDCPPEGPKGSYPSVHLLGIAHTDSTKINIKIDGNMSAGAARAAALEVIANFGKADFGK